MANAPLFSLGKCVMTRSVAEICHQSPQFHIFMSTLLLRHAQLDSPDICIEDQNANKEALQYGGRILTSYNLPEPLRQPDILDSKIWIITESDRSVTTVLFPSEY